MAASAVTVPWLHPGEMSAGGEEGGGGGEGGAGGEGGGGGEGREEEKEKCDQGGGRMSGSRIHFVEKDLNRGKCGLFERLKCDTMKES